MIGNRLASHGRLARVLAVALGLSLFSACGIPNDDAPIPIGEFSLPSELTENAPPTPLPDSVATNTQIWMVGPDERLSTVGREITRTPEGIMNALLFGTETEERERGITSAITRETGYTAPIDFNPTTGTAVVNLTPGSLRGRSTSEQELAFAQIVFSLIGLTDESIDVQGVAFTMDGSPLSVPIDGGASEPSQVLVKDDFASLNRQVISFDADLDEPAPPPTQPPLVLPSIGDESQLTGLSVWLVAANGNLVRVARPIRPTPEAIMRSLVLGPAIPERESGVTTALLPDALTVDVNEADGIAIVDMSPGSLPDSGTDRLRAVAQIVFSLTELDEVSTVIVSIGGVRQHLAADGLQPVQQVDPELVRSDFLGFAPDVDELGNPLDEGTASTFEPAVPADQEVDAERGLSDDDAGADITDGSEPTTPSPVLTPAPEPTP